MAILDDECVEVELAAEVDPRAMLLVARTVMRRYQRILRDVAATLDIDRNAGGRRLTDHQLAEVVKDKASMLMSANARRMGTLTHHAHAKKKPTRH